MVFVIKEHKTLNSGHMKTICVSTVLLKFGILPETYHHTWNCKTRKNIYCSLLRKNGWAVRSRKSQLPKGCSAGKARGVIKKISVKDPKGTKYVIGVEGHLLLMNSDGKTIVDTSPRQRDRRKVLEIYAVYPKHIF